MKLLSRRSFFALAFAGLASFAAVARAEMIYLVKITDFVKTPSYQLMTGPEKSELERTLKQEERVFPQVLEELKKAWKEDELSRDEPFPASKLAPRKLEVKGMFTDRQAAQKKLDAIEERAMDEVFDSGSGNKKKDKKLNPKQREKAKAREAKEAQKEAAAALLGKKIQERVDALLHPASAEAAE